MDKEINTITKIAIFRKKEIRKTIYNNEWWFSIIDIIAALTGTERPRKYWSDLKQKLIKEGYSEVSENIGQLKLQSSDGKFYETDCANAETLFRIIQSIPSPKVEPPMEYKKFKGLKRENLRDHMNDLELIFNMLGEASTTEIAKNKNARSFDENKTASQKGGGVAGKARKDLENKSGKKVSTKNNFIIKQKTMPKKNYKLPEEKMVICLEDCVSLCEKKGYFVLDKGKIKYTAFGKSYNFSDPKEKTRMMFYYELIEKYKYPMDKIEFEIGVPGGASNNYADIVVFTDDEKRIPYIAAECRGADISKIEFEQAESQAVTNAKLLKAKFAVCVAGDKLKVTEIDGLNYEIKIPDIPVCYGK